MKLFDLHAHPSLRAFGNYVAENTKYDIWKRGDNEFDGKKILREVDEDGFFRPVSHTLAGKIIANALEDKVALYTQSNLDEAVEGNVGCIVLSFYPIEQEFFKRGRVRDRHLFDKVLSMASGQSVEKIDQIQAGVNSYYQEYEADRSLLEANQHTGGKKNPQWRYRIVSNYSELQAVVKKDKELAIILSMEGVQGLANSIGAKNSYRQLKEEAQRNSSEFKEWQKGLLENLKTVKKAKDTNGKDRAPLLFLTIAHHFFNYVCGHCSSLNFPDFLVDQSDTYHYLQEGEIKNTHYFNLGIVDSFGYEIIKEALRRDPEEGMRRVIIDIKHMSPQARKDFYALLNTDAYRNELIPFVCSHTAVNGVPGLRRTGKKDSSRYFNIADLNSFDEDIKQIYKHDGLMGLMLDDGRTCSKYYQAVVRKLDGKIERKKKRINKIRKKFSERKNARALRRLARANELERQVNFLKQELADEYCDIFFRQVFHILNVLSLEDPKIGRNAWKIVTIGSDFDGVINPMDYYSSYGRLDDFRFDLIERWNDILEETQEDDVDVSSSHDNEFVKFLYGETPEYWIDKVFWYNANNFLKKYFHDDYLIHGRVGN
ncbi:MULTISPECIES: hypothetical protein [unclassified Carboxylicivirga]|uniref:hypothetical protein n=1 Tax=Carboxylicivirga TaxID=1628153 RepID=UPI003D350E2F